MLNLIPDWVLDGGQAIAALSKTERIVRSAAAVLGYVISLAPLPPSGS